MRPLLFLSPALLLTVLIAGCATRRPPASPSPSSSSSPSVVVAPIPDVIIERCPATAATAPTQPPSCDEIQAYIKQIDQRAPTLVVRRHVQGEDATSGFINELRSSGDRCNVVRVRSSWNGGCCRRGELADIYLRDGDVVAVIDASMPPGVGDAVLHGQEPKARTVLKRTLFCGKHINTRDRDVARESVRGLIEDVEEQERRELQERRDQQEH